MLLAFSTPAAHAGDTARELKKLVGYTIVSADTVAKVAERDGEKYIKLHGGSVYKVNFLLLDPLILTDVVVFAKPLPDELVRRYQGKVPARMLYSYKLMFDGDFYDAERQ